MNIGINASFLRKINTGIGQYTFNLLNALLNLKKNREHKFFLYFESKDGTGMLNKFSNVVEKVLPAPFYKRDDLVRKTVWEKLVIPREAVKDKLNLFFTPYNSATYFPKLKHIITIHDVVWKIFEKDYVNNFRKKIYFNQTYNAVKRANKIITVSEYSKKDIAKYLNIELDKIKVVYNGVPRSYFDRFSQKELNSGLKRFGLECPYLFYIGGFEKRKNLELLLEAFAKIVKNYASILQNRKLVIAGKLWEQENPLICNVNSYIKKLKIFHKVCLLNEVSEKEKKMLYQGANLFIYPSFYEGFGLSVLEAMASGCPVLSTNTSAIPEIAQNSVEYFNPNREDELIQQIIRILSNNEAIKILQEKGKERAMFFDWEKSAKKITEEF